jgi:hypothetical protein
VTHEVIDPLGFHHVVVIESGAVYGAENLAHHVPDQIERRALIERVIEALHLDNELPEGYRRTA